MGWRERAGDQAFEWLYGLVPVEEALRAGRRAVRELWVNSARRDARMERLVSMAQGIETHRVTLWELNRRTQGGNHQGVLARVDPFPWEELEELLSGQGPILMLEGIQDPRNLGAMIRSCVAMGAGRLVLERRHSAPLTPVVAKAASGGLEHVRMCSVPNLPRALREVKKAGYWVIGTADTGGVPLWEAEVPTEVAVMVGGEGAGLRRVVRRECDLWVTIPSEGAIGTYNASVAVAVLLYELMRRRRKVKICC